MQRQKHINCITALLYCTNANLVHHMLLCKIIYQTLQVSGVMCQRKIIVESIYLNKIQSNTLIHIYTYINTWKTTFWILKTYTIICQNRFKLNIREHNIIEPSGLVFGIALSASGILRKLRLAASNSLRIVSMSSLTTKLSASARFNPSSNFDTVCSEDAIPL